MKLSKGIIQVIFANILSLIISIGNGFVLPKYLSIETYANLKTFLMYTSYIGVLHFGYIDGVYIMYGGKKIEEINKVEFARQKSVLALFQLTITLPILFLSIYAGDLNLLFAAISILPINMVSFYKLVYQATGDFKEYRYITNLSSVLIFALNLAFIFVLKVESSLGYIGIQVIIVFIVLIYYEKKNKITGVNLRLSIKEIWCRTKDNIHTGIIIMLGNFMGIWITSIDRWFVKFFCNVAAFAYYSFAVTMLKLISVVATAFTVTLYNYFCKYTEVNAICQLRKIVLIIGAAIIAGIFPIVFVVQSGLENYISAVPVIRMLFAAQFILIVINAIYLNLYKALNLQRKYLIQMIIITIVTFLLNMIIGFLEDYNIASFAVATFLTSIIWLIICQIDLPKYRMSNNEWIYILLTMSGYFFCSYFKVWIGMTVYVCWISLQTALIFPKELKLSFIKGMELINKKCSGRM